MSDPINQGMEYNSDREGLIIPEYGRNVQKLIKHAKTIENPKIRQRFVEKVVDMMMQMHPQNRNVDDYREKLWKHVFRIANYELDVVPPFGEIPKPDDIRKHPEKVGYPVSEAKFRHYGHNVQVLIKKALAMPPGPKRDGFVNVIASYMKLAYKTWNKEHYVSDDIIKGDLESLSQGQLTLHEDTAIDNLSRTMDRRRPMQNNSGKRPGGPNGSGPMGGRDNKQRPRTYRRKK